MDHTFDKPSRPSGPPHHSTEPNTGAWWRFQWCRQRGVESHGRCLINWQLLTGRSYRGRNGGRRWSQWGCLAQELLASCHHDLRWILVSLLYGWGLAWVFVVFGCWIWFGISLWVGFLFGGLVDDGFRFEKSCVFGCGFMNGVCCVFPVYVNNCLWE